MSETPETNTVLRNNTMLPIGRQIINLTEHSRRMESQRNDVFKELNEAKRMLEWHKRKTQAAVDAFIAVKDELNQLKAMSDNMFA